MCGIFSLFNYTNYNFDKEFIIKQSKKGEHRGPDSNKIVELNNVILGFYRLAINGLNKRSDQPLKYNNKILICNGEIYNYKKLYDIMNIIGISDSDCEIILHLYEKYGIDYTVNALDGVFSFILIDNNIGKAFISRDSFGVRPLFLLKSKDSENNSILGFASELKQLYEFTNSDNFNANNDNANNDNADNFNADNFNADNDNADNFNADNYEITPFQPGQYMILNKENNNWNIESTTTYFSFNLSRINSIEDEIDDDSVASNIHDIFYEAVYKRVTTTDRPIACLLSGGLDSSIVASLVSRIYEKQLQTYSIGLEGSEDLKYAREVAKFINSEHTEIIVTEEDFFAFIPNVIEKIESYDTTTVRASVGNLLIGQYISETSQAKVIFNGDGSDELMGGYLYMNFAPDALEFDRECKRLLKDIHYFDVLRSDRSISTQGLEPRTPFLDKDFVTYYLSLPVEYRYKKNEIQEKYLFRKAFDKGYLPDEILWRKKEAFSDGVSSKNRSWYKIIDELVQNQKNVQFDIDKIYEHNIPDTIEKLYYRTLFEKKYKNQGHIIPYFWMPKYVDASDASARSLDIY